MPAGKSVKLFPIFNAWKGLENGFNLGKSLKLELKVLEFNFMQTAVTGLADLNRGDLND